MTAVADDLLSEQLIAQLLQNDLADLESSMQAEKLQLDQVIAVSGGARGRKSPKDSSDALAAPDTDAELALRMYISDAQLINDGEYAQAIQSQTSAADTVDWQYAQRLAANERKISLDAEFARRLQAIDDQGQDIDAIVDAESILGKDIARIDPNATIDKGPVSIKREEVAKTSASNGKGKGRQSSSEQSNYDESSEEEEPPSLNSIPYPICGICMEPFLATHSPFAAVLSANSSSRLPFGLRLPCPQEHSYCISCMSSYIQNKLDPDGTGIGKTSAIVFPIRCPECLIDEWPRGIEDDVAQRVLGQDGMVQWHHQKLLDSIPRLFCPNPKCSSLVEADEDNEDPQATCPSCQKLMCVPCRTAWHADLTCEEYQALPLDERSPEDRLLLDLAKVIVELVSGCNHMTCRCAATTPQGRCKRVPPCELWDEEMLLEERERRRNPPPPNRPPVPQPIAVHQLAPPPPPPYENPLQGYIPPEQRGQHNQLNWMDDPDVLSLKHWFTANMVNALTCGYCDLRLNSLADLRYHLAHVRRHPVYTCCGRFFKRRVDFEKHVASKGYDHDHQMVHD
ncbi:hypothetical protein H0H81_000092 [Sphagnurus paluster]|uniref:RBR-type E3 ubiquitin transferase n=1 Tax=Sphagnurus paluster TaxID=117069 RepID=A0A9P7GXB5_9AGAR|nr:hypothetical protein H0H81_000092 [Sphagnurus paluster]